MIPKRAIFFWEGGEMSWLRRQSIETFLALNPDWEVHQIRGEGVPIAPSGTLSIVHRSDWARYRELYERGGVYFDTDILFVKPIPDEFLESEMLLPLYETGKATVESVAALGSLPGTHFFRVVLEACNRLYEPGRVYDYQAFGVDLMESVKNALVGCSTHWYDPKQFIPVKWTKVSNLWNDPSEVKRRGGHANVPACNDPLLLGVHWFGGDPLSKDMEPKVDRAWMERSSSLVAWAWKKTMKGADSETHREQVGMG